MIEKNSFPGNLFLTIPSKGDKEICKYPNAQFTSTGNGIPISSTGNHFQY